MKASQSDHLRHSREFEVAQKRWRATQIETMIAEFDRTCVELEHQIEAQEKYARIYDPANFAYPTYAKAARERCERLQRSTNALRIELDKLKSEINESINRQFAA